MYMSVVLQQAFGGKSVPACTGTPALYYRLYKKRGRQDTPNAGHKKVVGRKRVKTA
jgi:hypothetical protein